MKKADTLAEVIRYFNPMQTLRDQYLTEWYIDRPNNPLLKMKSYLQGLGLNGMPVKILFTGHRGNGKSTELNKLAESIKNQFFIVNVDVAQSLSLSDLTYVDLLLSMALSLFERATAKDVLGKAPGQVTADLWTDLKLFLDRAIFGPASFSQDVPPKGEIGLTINAMAVQFQTKFAAEPTTRQAVRNNLEVRLAELHQKIDLVAGFVEQTTKRPVLFLVEGTDKPDLALARQIFHGHTYNLTAFRTSVIYTYPISLRYSTSFQTIKDSFHECYVLPNLNIARRDGSTDEVGRAKLTEAMLNRMESALIEPQAQTEIVVASGGLMRTLIRLTQRTAINALAAGQQTMTSAHAQAAVKAEQADFIASLKGEDYPVLLARHRDKELSADEAVLRLLETHALLEYANDTPWCDVHPIALPLAKKRTSPET